MKTETQGENPKFKCGFVTLLGLPNAGKSSLLNRLVGEELAIVTPKAQTTWKPMRGYVSRPGLEMVLTDTPGLQEGTIALNAALTKNAAKAVNTAVKGNELVALVVDAADIGSRLRDQKQLGLEAIESVLEKACGKLPLKLPVIPTFNKSDLIRKPEYRAQIEEAVLPLLAKVFARVEDPVWLSTKSGQGIEAWLESARKLLPEGEPHGLFEDDALTDQTLREFAAEYVREQCFLQLGEEIPYSIAVEIQSFDESDPSIARIEATLHVERDSQKGIVLGSGGAKIKAIGSKARTKLEKLMGTKVFLALRVKVTPRWARQEAWVRRFGYEA